MDLTILQNQTCSELKSFFVDPDSVNVYGDYDRLKEGKITACLLLNSSNSFFIALNFTRVCNENPKLNPVSIDLYFVSIELVVYGGRIKKDLFYSLPDLRVALEKSFQEVERILPSFNLPVLH